MAKLKAWVTDTANFTDKVDLPLESLHIGDAGTGEYVRFAVSPFYCHHTTSGTDNTKYLLNLALKGPTPYRENEIKPGTKDP